MEEYLDDLGTTITLGSYEDIIALAHIGIEPAEMALAHYFADPAAQAHDLTKAYYWYKQAAAKGSADNQYQLALCYWEGKGTNQDDVAAYHFFEKKQKTRREKSQERRVGAEGQMVEKFFVILQRNCPPRVP